MNEYDTQKLYRILATRYTPVDSVAQADLVVVNTCSVREKPEHKLYSLLGELKELKQQNPEVMIGVGGCVAQQEGDRILRRNNAVDFVFGTHNLSLVPSLIDRRKSGFGPQVAIDYRDEWEELPLGLDGGSRVSAFVAISRGCNKACSYCIVPTTRGPEVSRPLSEIEREIKLAVHRGAREVLLLGQTVNSYGLDLNPRVKFSEMLDHISAIDKLERIRFTSPHPQEIRQDFIDLICRNLKICRHVHLPLQSGSDEILKAMNRNYRRKRYLEIIAELKARVPDVALTTDIIVGFPGESERDFEATLDVIREVQFDSSYSFIFSPRPGTPAALMPDDVSQDVKSNRLEQLQVLQDQITTERLQAWVGREVQVLFEGPSKLNSKCMRGRTSQNLMLNLDDENTELEPGELRQVMVTGVAQYTLRGRASGELSRATSPLEGDRSQNCSPN